MKTTTLTALATKHKRAPKLLAAIQTAIKKHGADSEALVISGLPSHRRGSNCASSAVEVGWTDYAIYPGPHRQCRTAGFRNVLVKIA